MLCNCSNKNLRNYCCFYVLTLRQKRWANIDENMTFMHKINKFLDDWVHTDAETQGSLHWANLRVIAKIETVQHIFVNEEQYCSA